MAWLSSWPRIIARLASSGSTSIRPRLITIVWPTVNDSSGDVSSTRHLIGASSVTLFVTNRLLSTVSSTPSTGPAGARMPARVEAIDHVVFGLLLPAPLARDRRQLSRRIGAILHRRLVDLNRGELLLRPRAFQVVAPEAHLGLHLRQPRKGQLVVGRVRFLAIHVGRQPQSRERVHAPAVDVERDLLAEEARERVVDVPADAVEPHDVVVAILHPDASGEAIGLLALRFQIEHEAARLAEKLAADEREVVPLPVQEPPVRHGHRGEAIGQILHAERLLDQALLLKGSLVDAERRELRAVLHSNWPRKYSSWIGTPSLSSGARFCRYTSTSG